MKIHRFIVDVKLVEGPISIQDENLVRQMFSVLKLKVGEQVALSDGKGHEAMGKIAKIDKKHVSVILGTPRICANEPRRQVTLCCAILKRENFEWVVQKAAEVGVSRIVPLLTERTVKQALKVDRLKSIAKEASEQSGRCRVPDISDPVTLAQAVSSSDSKQSYFFHTGDPVSPAVGVDAFFGPPTIRPTDEEINIFIGPEGGWTENEVEIAKKSGCRIAGLGPLVLRGETAAVCASFVAVAAKIA